MLLRHRGLCLLLGLTALAVPLSSARADEKTVTLAHIKLSGGLDEAAPNTDPLLGGLKETFHTKLERIKKAKNDKKIQGLYLQLDGLTVGWGKVDELSRAVEDFRKSGKKVYAFLESGTAKDYLVGLACDEVAMPEAGWLLLTGVRAEITFYKNLFDKIGIKADMLQMGEAKTAAEPYTRTRLTDASRKQLEIVLDDYYEKSLVERIVRARPHQKWTAAQVKKLLDEGPFVPRRAQKIGLIDRVAYEGPYRDLLKSALHADHVKMEWDYAKEKAEFDFSDILSIYRKLLFSGKSLPSLKPKLAVIYASGVIVTGKSSEGLLSGETCGSETIVKAIRTAEKDATVRAIVLRVNSPGGSALASDLIWDELRKCKKPVVASMSDVAASGGYYISMGARKIYAEPGTLTGSIGVVGGKFALSGLYDLIGLNTEVISRGANTGILSADRPFTASERKAMHAMMQDIYDGFVDKALEGRQRAGHAMKRDQLLKLAGGRIWTGRQAKANGLVDELGTLADALAAAQKMAGIPADRELELLQLPKSKGLLDSLLDRAETRAPGLGATRLPLLRQLPELAGALSQVEALLRLRGEPVWAVLPYRIDVR